MLEASHSAFSGRVWNAQRRATRFAASSRYLPKVSASVGKTHRQLFQEFYESLYPNSSFSALFDPEPVHAKLLFHKMIHDIQSHGTRMKPSSRMFQRYLVQKGVILLKEPVMPWAIIWRLNTWRITRSVGCYTHSNIFPWTSSTAQSIGSSSKSTLKVTPRSTHKVLKVCQSR